MGPLAVDFQARRRPISPLGLLLVGLGTAAMGAFGVDYLGADEELERVEAQVERARRHQRPVRAQAPATATGKDERAAVRAVLKELRTPWGAVLGELELASDATVALLDVTTTAQGRMLRLTAEAKTMSDALAYVGRLRASPWRDSVHLSGHEAKQAAGVPVVRFSVDAAWSGPS